MEEKGIFFQVVDLFNQFEHVPIVTAPIDARPYPDQAIPGKVLRPDLPDFLERRIHDFGHGLCDLPGVHPVVGFMEMMRVDMGGRYWWRG